MNRQEKQEFNRLKRKVLKQGVAIGELKVKIENLELLLISLLTNS